MLTITVIDLAGNVIYDPERAIDYAYNIQYETAWPKGYMTATFQVKRADIFADWIIRESFTVLIYDDATLVWDGRIESFQKNINGTEEIITVMCVGWHVILEERDLRKRWIDIKAISYLEWPPDYEENEQQTTWMTNKRDSIIQVFAGTGDLFRQKGENYRELYTTPAGYIRRVIFNWIARTGEDLRLRLVNEDNTGIESEIRVSSRTPVKGQEDHTLTLGNTRAITLRWVIDRTDIFDQNDYFHVSKLRVETYYETGHRAATPTYTQGQLIEDIILLVNQKGAQLSIDFARLGEPGFILDPFVVEEPTYAARVIEKIASYGDADLNSWGLCVWGRDDTSDNKPRVVFEARDVNDYEYIVQLSQAELAGLNYEKVSDELHNAVTAQYVDERDIARYRTATDTDSITAEYRRDFYIRLGAGDVSRADYINSRYLAYHKDRRTRGSFSVRGFITTKGGGQKPASQVRAGERVKLLNTDEIFFIRSTSYDDEAQTIRISPDMPDDNLNILFTQRERNLGRLAQ